MNDNDDKELKCASCNHQRMQVVAVDSQIFCQEGSHFELDDFTGRIVFVPKGPGEGDDMVIFCLRFVNSTHVSLFSDCLISSDAAADHSLRFALSVCASLQRSMSGFFLLSLSSFADVPQHFMPVPFPLHSQFCMKQSGHNTDQWRV